MIVQLIVFHVVLVEFQNKLSLMIAVSRLGAVLKFRKGKKGAVSKGFYELFYSSKGCTQVFA